MKFLKAFFLTILMIVSIVSPVFADTSSGGIPQIQGEGACLIDVTTGQTLFTKDPNKPLAPASTTKIMTGLLAIEHGDLDDIVTASSTMLDNKLVYGTQIYLEPGEQMPLRDYLYALFLNSANDAAVAIAEHIGKSIPNFVEMMNERAAEIGATQTHFVNPSGLTETGHVTTAHDLALIARVAYQNPLFAEYVRTKSHTISRSHSNVPTVMMNENKLLWRDSNVDGIKTGYTAAAQNCLVASITKDGRQLIGVILKSPGREIYTDMQDMFEYGLTQTKNTIIKPAGSVMSTITVNNETVNLLLDRPIYMTQRINEQGPNLNLQTVFADKTPLNSVEKGQIVANVEVSDGKTILNKIPLKASRSVQPETVPKKKNSNLMFWILGVIGTGVLILGFFSFNKNKKKKYPAARYRNEDTMLTRRRESN